MQRLRLLLLLSSRWLFSLGFAWTFALTQRRRRPRRKTYMYMSSRSTVTDASIITTPLKSITARQQAVLDGPEYQTLLASLGRPLVKNDAATWTVVVGETEDNMRVVGVMASESMSPAATAIYTDSMATIPMKPSATTIAPTQAMATMIHALTHVHSCMPPEDASLYKKQHWHIVIVGGGELAQMASKSLHQGLGFRTTMVTTRKDLTDSMQPAVGELELGFAQVIGNFDVLLDTVGDEFCDQKSSVIRLLRERHGCDRYLSTRTRAQEIVSDEGILFGSNQAKDYIRRMQERKDLAQFVPPKGLGATVKTLLEKGLFFKFPDGNPKQTLYIRGWNLKKYWEAATWPRDSAGGANIRFGFPVPDDLDGIEERFMINEPPARLAPVLVQESTEDEEADQESSSFLFNVVGVNGLQSQIIDSERDCLLFLSAPFCRTCRYLSPQYLRMARMEQGKGVTFAKANASGKIGKDLGKALDVDSVPTFLLFRKGKLFGKPLSISRLPSKKLQLAIDLLREGASWDEAMIRDADQKCDT